MRVRHVRRLASAVLLAVILGGVAVAAQGLVYHGNVQSHIFHGPGCRYYDCKACSAVFESREAAIKAGYRPCKVCNP